MSPFPKRSQQKLQLHQQQKSGSSTQQATDPVQLPAATPAPNQDLINHLHHLETKVLLGVGIDPCKEFRRTQADQVLERVRPGHTKCSSCDKQCYSIQKLREHIRAKHMAQISYKCSVCSKCFGSGYSLKLHKRCHKEKLFKCHLCHKYFDTQSNLNTHSKEQLGLLYKCSYCKRDFAQERSLKSHRKMCKKQPGGPPPKVSCDLCSKKFTYEKDLKKHKREFH